VYTRHRMKTDKTENLTQKTEGAQELAIKGQHWVHKTQDEDRQNRKSNTENNKNEQHRHHQINNIEINVILS